MANPIENAEKNISKQIKQIAESKADDATKNQLSAALAGVRRLLQTVDQVSDPKNPPASDTAWGKVIALGKNQRQLSAILSGAEDAF